MSDPFDRAVVIREGASLHTADELALCFVDDCLALGASLSPYGREVYDEACLALSEGARWLENDDLAQELHDLAGQIESDLGDYWVVWEDGYVIYDVRGLSDEQLDDLREHLGW